MQSLLPCMDTGREERGSNQGTAGSPYREFNMNRGLREQRVVYQAEVYRPPKTFGLLLCQLSGASDLNDETSKPCRLLELFRRDCDLNPAVVETASPEILQGIELCACAERCEQKLGRRHSSVLAAVFEGLIAND